LQHEPQPESQQGVSQQVGSGAQQVGSGAQQVGSGAQQVGSQQPLFRWNSPAWALLALAKAKPATAKNENKNLAFMDCLLRGSSKVGKLGVLGCTAMARIVEPCRLR
jgi:hypothetical protein